ncbi:MAG: DUF4783 domain-containing protein, partial [Bacteroidetes bacterium]|nr:DUF4783 domain-containing protein [Bacteroidota bacterium]
SVEIPHAEVEKAFNENDATKVMTFCKDKVLLKVLGEEGAYSQTQAKLVIKDFFQKYPKGKFSFIFKGKAQDSGSFSIGNYEVKDKTFRVTLHFKKLNTSYLVETIQIE